MSKPTYLYRVVLTDPLNIFRESYDHEAEAFVKRPDVLPAGSILGRQTGYLARSSAESIAERYRRVEGAECGVIRSEPVVFLTEREKEAKRADELEAEAKRIRARIETPFVEVHASDPIEEAIKARFVSDGLRALRNI